MGPSAKNGAAGSSTRVSQHLSLDLGEARRKQGRSVDEKFPTKLCQKYTIVPHLISIEMVEFGAGDLFGILTERKLLA
jgi:hypothetical protein